MHEDAFLLLEVGPDHGPELNVSRSVWFSMAALRAECWAGRGLWTVAAWPPGHRTRRTLLTRAPGGPMMDGHVA